jgi:hypothetical protein
MKPSSILMSSFGALLILISVHENALKRTDDLSKTDQTVAKAQPMMAINEASSVRSALPVSKITNDFSYLKFNVSDFESTETGNDEMPAETNFDYLKFKASDYIETKIDVLPGDSDFNYLKFDVNDYKISTCRKEELPSADLDYLKFDVQKFVQNDSLSKINELPEHENL